MPNLCAPRYANDVSSHRDCGTPFVSLLLTHKCMKPIFLVYEQIVPTPHKVVSSEVASAHMNPQRISCVGKSAM